MVYDGQRNVVCIRHPELFSDALFPVVFRRLISPIKLPVLPNSSSKKDLLCFTLPTPLLNDKPNHIRNQGFTSIIHVTHFYLTLVGLEFFEIKNPINCISYFDSKYGLNRGLWLVQQRKKLKSRR